MFLRQRYSVTASQASRQDVRIRRAFHRFAHIPPAVIYVNGTFPESLLASTAPPLYGALKTLGFESCLEAISQLFCLSVFQPCAQYQLDNGPHREC